MDSSATVSIALATYNGETYLPKLLESLSAQTLRPSEIVVGDDRSTDATLDVLRAFAARSAVPVRVRRNQQHLDYADNFLQTASRCRGGIVAFCDQDDVWLPQKLERCVRELEAHAADLCAHDAIVVDAGDHEFGYHSPGIEPGLHDPLRLPPFYVFFGFTMVFRKTLLDAVPFAKRPADNVDPSKQLSHDRWLYFLGTTLGKTIYLREPLVRYRQHAGNVFGDKGGASFWLKVRKLLTEYPRYVSKYRALSAARLEVLREIPESSAVDLDAVARAVDYWCEIAEIYDQRVALSQTSSALARVRGVADLARRGAYRDFARGGLSLQALYEDVIASCIQLPKPARSVGEGRR
jgi:glycosyltransferase involved in cell wall biosynthesis